MGTTKDELIELLVKKGISDSKVIKAMREVDRAYFVPDEMKANAYDDEPLPIGYQQVISQPYLVAYMAQELMLKADDIILEVGTGSGYNAAVLSNIVSHETVIAKGVKRNLEFP